MGRQRQVRVIRPGKNEVNGISVPKDIAVLSAGTYFSARRTGSSIIFESGCRIEYTQEQIQNYKFENGNNNTKR